jgi:enamine deaminase RidA (YjgF/YER057c/UK114 family)
MKDTTTPRLAAGQGLCHGVMARGQMVFVAGQVGWDEKCEFPGPTTS